MIIYVIVIYVILYYYDVLLNLHYIFLNLHYIYLNLHSRIFKSTFNVYLILQLGKKSRTRKKIRDKYAIYF